MASTPARFTMDEARAAQWVAALIAQTDSSGSDVNPDLPPIGAAYCAAMDETGSDTYLLIRAAQDAGIIADTEVPSGFPDRLGWQFIADSGGYRWLLYHDGSGPVTHWLLGDEGASITASCHRLMGHLGGGRGVWGAESALEVLREAVAAGNEMAAAATSTSDAEALDRIQHILRDPDWGVGMLVDIEGLVQATGRSTENLPGDEPTWDRH